MGIPNQLSIRHIAITPNVKNSKSDPVSTNDLDVAKTLFQMKKSGNAITTANSSDDEDFIITATKIELCIRPEE